jgi:hypothetical protein
MKVLSTFIVDFALPAWRESKTQLKGGFTCQHRALDVIEPKPTA